MSIEKLKSYADYFGNQEGRAYPCSNQSVVCGVITDDRQKAISIMNEKGAIIKSSSYNRMEWELDDQRWLWRVWNSGYRGYRFYKVLVDANISDELLDYFVVPYCGNYCCSFEII